MTGRYAKAGMLDFLGFKDTYLNPRIRNGLHAMALNENRKDFDVTRKSWPGQRPNFQSLSLTSHRTSRLVKLP